MYNTFIANIHNTQKWRVCLPCTNGIKLKRT